jgi:asparagine synthase (glutamine-hydrolysing)
VLSGEGADELFSGYTRYLIPHSNARIRSLPELSSYAPLVDYYYGKPLDQFARLLNRGAVSDETVKMVIAPHFGQFDELRHAMGYTEFKLMLVTLLQMEDRTTAAFGIENRSPFLDPRLIAFAFSISGDLKIHENTTKWILKQVARRYLPPAIVDRTDKKGLVAPINLWMNFRGARGEFDRQAYNDLMMERWFKVFYTERRFAVAASRAVVQA